MFLFDKIQYHILYSMLYIILDPSRKRRLEPTAKLTTAVLTADFTSHDLRHMGVVSWEQHVRLSRSSALLLGTFGN
ncbi:GM23301 [Drosophila sechellia]|uniref:GM23301 n=1 Tax=Drosophila sechellia TaxID=7238 RepID=B4IFG8_DROSE|nr:GM23301 [Drosophila sechellia]